MLADNAETRSINAEINLADPSLYLNRELSWLQFNWRVLEEALNERRPLLERVKFLAIFANNLDEFFMTRVAGLRQQVSDGVLTAPPDGMTPLEQLAAIRQTLSDHLARHAACWQKDLLPALRQANIHVCTYDDLQPKQRAFVCNYFRREIFPTLTPIRRHDLLLYHPYDSFMPVVDFIRQAAHDPNVLAIKQTLYRIGPNSPIVTALIEARENRKQVAVLLELKARFDEENNIGWAHALEDSGVHVVYGVMGLKTHAKVCLVVRREAEGIRRYVHLGTGNYNAVTARLYTDLSYFTCDEDIGADASDLFNALTGYSRKETYRKLLVAPGTMRHGLLMRIEREIDQQQQHGNGYLAFKMNALVDKDCIQALYRASQAGVKIDLQVRGICCLRPGVPGVSEHITVTSIVGRFLEHSRIYYFRNAVRKRFC